MNSSEESSLLVLMELCPDYETGPTRWGNPGGSIWLGELSSAEPGNSTIIIIQKLHPMVHQLRAARRTYRRTHVGEVRCFRRARTGDIVCFVKASCAIRARFAVAILSLALLYASTCSAACAICLHPVSPPITESHDCDHAASNPSTLPGGAQSNRTSGDSHRQCPAKPDCLGHRHSSFEFVQGDGQLQFHARAIDYAHASHLSVSVFNAAADTVAASFLSDLAPPRHATIPSQQKISILRI